jgi:hypothetical protein
MGRSRAQVSRFSDIHAGRLKREATMTNEMQEAIDRMQILQLQAAYARGVDRVDRDLLRSVYWPEATDDHGQFNGAGHDFADGLAERLPRTYASTTHMLGQTYFHSLDDKRATTETNFYACHAPANRAEAGFTFNGRYLDLLEKRQGVWKILRREVVFDQYAQVAYGQSHMESQVVGQRRPDDRSYGFFQRMAKEPQVA